MLTYKGAGLKAAVEKEYRRDAQGVRDEVREVPYLLRAPYKMPGTDLASVYHADLASVYHATRAV